MISGGTTTTAENHLAESYNGIAGPKADDFFDNLLEKIPGSTKFWNYFYTLFMVIFVLLGTSVVILLAVFFHNRIIFPIDSTCTTGSKDIVVPSNVISDFWKKCSSFSETKYPSSFYYSLQEVNCMKSEGYGRALNLMSVPKVKRSIVNNVINIADQYLSAAPSASSCSNERARILAIQNKYKNYLAIIDKGGDVQLPKFFKTFVYQKSLEQALTSNNALQHENDAKYSWISTIPETINEQKEPTIYGLALSNKFENFEWGLVRRMNDDYGSRLWATLNDTTTAPLFKDDNFDLLTNFVVADSTNMTAFYELLDSQIQNPTLKSLINQNNNTNLVVTVSDMNAELMLLNLARINSEDRSNVMAEYTMMLAKNNGDGNYEQRTRLTWGSSKEPAEGILQRLSEASFQSAFVLQGFSKQSVFDQDFLNFVVRDGSEFTFYTTDIYCKKRIAKTYDEIQVTKCGVLERELTYSATPEYDQISAHAIFDPANQFYVGLLLDSDDDDDDIYEELANGDATEFHF